MELCISKKIVAEIKKIIEEDDEHSKEIQAMWEGIVGKCTEVARKNSDTGYSLEDIFAVLLICYINKADDKLCGAALNEVPKLYEEEKAKDSKLQEKAEFIQEEVQQFKEIQEKVKVSALYPIDDSMAVGSVVISTTMAGRATAGAVLTALIVKSAEKGSKAVCHCAKMGGVARKVVIAAKVFRVATGVTSLSVALTTIGTIVDLVFLIHASYKIHKKSDSSAGKELIKVKDVLEKSRDQLQELKECLDMINSTVLESQ